MSTSTACSSTRRTSTPGATHSTSSSRRAGRRFATLRNTPPSAYARPRSTARTSPVSGTRRAVRARRAELLRGARHHARTEEYARRKQRVVDEHLRPASWPPTGRPAIRACRAWRRNPDRRGLVLEDAALLLGQIRSMPSPIARVFATTSSGRASPCSTFATRDVSGRELAHGGKPHPEIFLTAARELGRPRGPCLRGRGRRLRCTGREGGRQAAVGLARAGEADALAAADADLVVSTLDEVDLPALSEG